MNLLKSMVALAAMCLGTMEVAAQTETAYANVKMTYINGSDENVEVAYGEIPLDQPAYAGFNKISGDAVALGNKAWGVNNIAYLRVDASSTPGVIQKATLKADFQQISARGMAYGVGYNDSEWSADMTWNTADRSITLMGSTKSTAKATDDVALEFDITDAMKYENSYIATVLVYNTAAGGGYIKNPIVEVEYEPYEATTTTFDFEDGNKVFTDDSRITSAIETDATLGSNVLGWTCANNAQNGYSFSHFDFTSLLDKPALVKVEFDYYNTKGGRAILNIGDALVRSNTGGSSKVTYNKTGAIFQIGSDKNNAFINGINIGQDDKVISTPIIDEETGEEVGTVETTELGLCDKWLHVVVMINNDAKTVTWAVTDQDEELVHLGTGDFFAEDANEATQIDIFGYINGSHCAMIDNLKITNYKSNAQFADYTIKYVGPDGNEIKESRSGNGQVGKFVVMLDSDKAAIVADVAEGGIDGKMKYIYVSDDSETTPIAAENTVITVTFREAEIYAGVLNCMIEGQSGTAARLASYSGIKFFEGNNYYVYPPRGYGKDGVYYFTPATGSYNGATFTFPGSLNSRTLNNVVTYIGQLNYAAVDSVAYYSDFERLALPVEDEGNGTGLGQLVGTVNSWWSFSGGIFDRFSQGRGIRLDAGSYVYTEPIAEAGTYKVTIYGRNDVSAGDPNPYALGYMLGDDSFMYKELAIPEWGSATTGSSVVENVAIPAGAQLIICNNNEGTASKISLDDISMTKTGDFEEPVTVGINTVKEVAQPMNSTIYNLQGQAVKAAVKGLYIKNGKKVVIK